MTRFNITLEDGVCLVLYAIQNMWGGEIFVPKIPSYRILDMAEAIGPKCRKEIVGIRPGEKIHEEMITETDSQNTIEFEKHYVIVPSYPTWDVASYSEAFMGSACPANFKYNSGANKEWLNVEQIRSLLCQHVDQTFVA
jgi:FlaA1/EpsC-like NDP-sugar epimerase